MTLILERPPALAADERPRRGDAAYAVRWHASDPWVTAGIAALGELLTVRDLTAANPASNSGAFYATEVFSLDPGCFRVGDLEVRWSRHIGRTSMQNRACSREDWAALAASCRASLAG
jgi:hypothetical protein